MRPFYILAEYKTMFQMPRYYCLSIQHRDRLMNNSVTNPSDNLETPSKCTNFDGVIKNASICDVVYGQIFEASPIFEDGAFITTSKIVNVGTDQDDRWFVETITGNRYLISSVEFNPTLQSTASVEAAMLAKRDHIDNNKDYYRELLIKEAG